MALVMIPFLAGYSRSAAPPRAPSRELSRASSAAPAQIFHAGATMTGEDAVKRQQGNNRAPTEFQLNLGALIDSLRTDYPLLFVEPQDLSLFDESVELHGPSGQRLIGIGQYTAVLDLLRFSRRVAMDDAELTHRITIDGRSVRVRWSAKLWIKDPTLGLTSFHQEPVLVNVDGVSRYDLDGKGHVHLHALENIVMSGPDTKLLDFPNLELMWRVPKLVPAGAGGAQGWPMPVPAHGAVAHGAVASTVAVASAVAATRERLAAARSTGARRTAAPSMSISIDETYEGRNPSESPVDRAARERQEDADEAARLRALRTPPPTAEKKSGGMGLPDFLKMGKLKAPNSCETNYDCERPMVCCDLVVARVCCSSGMGLGPQRKEGEMSLQGQLIPIPIKKGEAGSWKGGDAGSAPPQGNQPW